MSRKPRPTLKPVSYPGQQYGTGVDAVTAQKAIPLPNAAGQTDAAITQAASGPQVPQQVMDAANAPRSGPGPVTPLDAPTDRPHEPITAGAPWGPGPGPSAAAGTGTIPPDPVAEQLMAMLAAYPNDDLASLVESIKAGDYSTGGTLGPRYG